MTAANLDQAMMLQPGFKLFTLRGRLGRARYVLACFGAVFASYIFLLVLNSLLMLFGRFGMMVTYTIGMILYFALLPVFIAMLTVRRAHDFNRSGWMALLILLPLVGRSLPMPLGPVLSLGPLLFWLWPGSRGENRYGAALPQEKLLVRILAIVLPVFLLTLFCISAIQRAPRPSAAPSASTSTLQQYKP